MAEAEPVVKATGQQPDQAIAQVPAFCQLLMQLHMDLSAVAELVLPCCPAIPGFGQHHADVQMHFHHRDQLSLKHVVFHHTGDQQMPVHWIVTVDDPAVPPDFQKQRMVLSQEWPHLLQTALADDQQQPQRCHLPHLQQRDLIGR